MLKRQLPWIACLLAGLASLNCAASQETMVFSIDDSVIAEVLRMNFGSEYQIFAEGVIDNQAADRFKQFVRQHGIEHAKVHFDSEGGSLLTGLQLGQAIRDLGFSTTIGQSDGEGGTRAEGICASACSYAFAGGVYRHYTQETQRLGLHQFFYTESGVGDVGDAQVVSGLLVQYLQRMGVDADAFGVSTRARRDSMVWLSINEALELHFANNGAQPTTAEVKLLESSPYSPYLKLEQARSGAMSRVLMICLKNELYVWGGVVVPQATSQEHLETALTSYLEFDDQLKIELSAAQGARPTENVLWVIRKIPHDRYEAVANAKLIGTWLEDGSPMRWGTHMDLMGVSESVRSYVQRCQLLQN